MEAFSVSFAFIDHTEKNYAVFVLCVFVTLHLFLSLHYHFSMVWEVGKVNIHVTSITFNWKSLPTSLSSAQKIFIKYLVGSSPKHL